MRHGWNVLVICVFWVLNASGQTPSPTQLIRDVRVFDGERVLDHQDVLLENGKISKLATTGISAPNAEVIDGKGRTLLPGLIDAHVHIVDRAEDAARQALKLGVTTQLDMFSGGERMKKIKTIEADDPPDVSDLRTAGVGATVPGGHPTQMGGPSFPTITGPEQAQEFVDARIAEGSDYIKIIHDDGSTWNWTTKRVAMLDNRTMRALVEAAHKRGKLAVVHALSEQQARDAIEAGADGLVHIFTGEKLSGDFGEFAAPSGIHHSDAFNHLSGLRKIGRPGARGRREIDGLCRAGWGTHAENGRGRSIESALLQCHRRSYAPADRAPCSDFGWNRCSSAGNDLSSGAPWRTQTARGGGNDAECSACCGHFCSGEQVPFIGPRMGKAGDASRLAAGRWRSDQEHPRHAKHRGGVETRSTRATLTGRCVRVQPFELHSNHFSVSSKANLPSTNGRELAGFVSVVFTG